MGQIKSNFQVGDRVTNLNLCGGMQVLGKTGTIKRISGRDHLVEFDEDIGGHSGDGTGKDTHCWWVFAEGLNLIPREWDS